MAGPRAQPVVRSFKEIEGGEGYISPISPLYRPCISPDQVRSFREIEGGEGYISPISPLHLPYISPDQVRSFREIEGGEAAHQSLGLLGQVHD